MNLSFYESSVESYLQILGSVRSILSKARQAAEEGNLDLEALVDFKLQESMLPFSFQIVSVWHQSLGAIQAMRSGEFTPPPKLGELDFAALEGLVDEAISELEKETPDDINALAGGAMVFRLGDREIPFTTSNFLTSFALPNFYFHATTAYDMLRMQGLPLGKKDFLGQMRVGH